MIELMQEVFRFDRIKIVRDTCIEAIKVIREIPESIIQNEEKIAQNH